MFFYKISFLNEELYYTEPSPSVGSLSTETFSLQVMLVAESIPYRESLAHLAGLDRYKISTAVRQNLILGKPRVLNTIPYDFLHLA
jgi:hypothetical protein